MRSARLRCLPPGRSCGGWPLAMPRHFRIRRTRWPESHRAAVAGPVRALPFDRLSGLRRPPDLPARSPWPRLPLSPAFPMEPRAQLHRSGRLAPAALGSCPCLPWCRACRLPRSRVLWQAGVPAQAFGTGFSEQLSPALQRVQLIGFSDLPASPTFVFQFPPEGGNLRFLLAVTGYFRWRFRVPLIPSYRWMVSPFH